MGVRGTLWFFTREMGWAEVLPSIRKTWQNRSGQVGTPACHVRLETLLTKHLHFSDGKTGARRAGGLQLSWIWPPRTSRVNTSRCFGVGLESLRSESGRTARPGWQEQGTRRHWGLSRALPLPWGKGPTQSLGREPSPENCTLGPAHTHGQPSEGSLSLSVSPTGSWAP